MKKTLLLSAIFLASCGGRVAQPAPLENDFDHKLSCAHMTGEHSNHDKRLTELGVERKDKPLQNVGMMLTSPLFLDFSQSQKKEIAAIYARQGRLADLMSAKNCP